MYSQHATSKKVCFYTVPQAAVCSDDPLLTAENGGERREKLITTCGSMRAIVIWSRKVETDLRPGFVFFTEHLDYLSETFAWLGNKQNAWCVRILVVAG